MKINKITFLLLLASFSIFETQAQNKEDQKVILITLDGFRWQELFTGADPQLISNTDYVHDTTRLKTKFWRETEIERREALLPFIWNEVANLGEIHGNSHG